MIPPRFLPTRGALRFSGKKSGLAVSLRPAYVLLVNLGASLGALNKVYFYLQTPNRPTSSLNIIATDNPNNFAVKGNGTHFQNGITAFIVDADCSDNVGTITMTVTRRQ